MRDYTKHKIYRAKSINADWFEVVFEKDSLKFVPGSQLTLYSLEQPPVFIGSGIQEPWLRIVMNRDLFDIYKDAKSIKFSTCIANPLPTLATAESPSFIITPEGASAYFSYASTYPSIKSKVCYLGSGKFNEDWIEAYQEVVKDPSSLKLDKELYIIGDRDLLTQEAGELLNSSEVYLV